MVPFHGEGESINEKSSANMLNDFCFLHLVFRASVSQWEGEKSAQFEECTYLPTLFNENDVYFCFSSYVHLKYGPIFKMILFAR